MINDGGLKYMVYIIIGICIVVMVVISLTVFIKKQSEKPMQTNAYEQRTVFISNNENEGIQEFTIQMEVIAAEALKDESRLIEITDNNLLSHVNALVPGMAQLGNSINNLTQSIQLSGKVFYKAILPAGAKLTDSKSMENAVRGFFRGPNGIKGHANFVATEVQNGTTIMANTVATTMSVASMVVGQYYMEQINKKLEEISDGINKIVDFQDNEYCGRVLSLIAHVKTIADFQTEILDNYELRMSKINQLDNLEEECTKLLSQANLQLGGYSNKRDLNFCAYEKTINEVQKWYTYQKSMLDTLTKISELRYTLYLGTVSRDQCGALLLIFAQEVSEIQDKLANWHQVTLNRLNINIEDAKRKRDGFDGAIHFIPSLFNDELNFRSIETSTVSMIEAQLSNNKVLHQDTSNLFTEDVELISKDGKVYYLPSDTSD